MYDLTIPQQNIWNLQRFYEGTSVSNNCGAIFFEEKCDHRRLNQAINKLIELQEGMRLRFCEKDGHPVQYVAAIQPELFPSQVFDDRAAFERYAERYARIPFDLIDRPMYRFVIFDLEDISGVLLCVDHLIADAWAISIIANTVYEQYDALSKGKLLEEKRYSYLPFIGAERSYLHSPRYEKDKRYWSDQYPVRPEIGLIKPDRAPAAGSAAKRYTKTLTAGFSAAIDRFYQQENISQAVLFEAAVITYLHRIDPEAGYVSIGVPVLNRSGAAEKNAVGMCISTTPLTVSVSGEETALQLCRRIASRQFDLFRHQRFPYSHILHELHERYGFSGNLYDVIVSFQNARTGARARTQWFSNGHCEVGLGFHIDDRDGKGCYTLNIDYQTARFSHDGEVRLLTERILGIIEQIIQKPSMLIKEVSILPPDEYQKVIFDFNKTQVTFSREKCVHELFTEQVKASPDRMALIFQGQSFTYRQLDEMSASLAYHLRGRGIGPGSVVPIISRRSWHVIVAMLGILKAGGAYMPVDPTYPRERIGYMLEAARCSLALTYGYPGQLAIERVRLEEFDFNEDITPVKNWNGPEDLCYIIFTSGSTGKPKGVSLCHRNVVNYASDNCYNTCHSAIRAKARSIVSVTNIIFDIFVTESLFPLLNGIRIYLADDRQVFSQKELARLITSEPIDVMQTTPTKMRSYIMDKLDVAYLRRLKVIILGGEALPADLYLELRSYTDARIFNIYGPAETTVWSTNKCVEDTAITIGRPIANTQIYILDADRRPLPIGVAGELCISGEGVGKGYLDDPGSSAERFVPDPFIPGTVMYRTGDLACWEADGEIGYLGRIDTQVKIRGQRVELGEIESIMSSFHGIGLTAVADKCDETGRQYLAGYYTTKTKIDEKELRHYLNARLPKYMVPNYFVRLDEMPMTASGKTDRKSLPVPGPVEQERIYMAPETPTEQKIAAIWEELLHTTHIGKTEDLFALGGDSLVAIHLLAKLEEAFDVAVTVKDILEHPGLEQLAAFIDHAGPSAVKIRTTGANGYELLPQQLAIYTVCRKDVQTLTYNMPARIKLPEEIDRERLKKCLLQLPKIHPGLKTAVRTVDGVPCAVIDRDMVFTVEICQDEHTFVRPFDLEKGPLMHLAFTEDALLFDMHHIIADGRSLDIILRDLEMLYAGDIPVQPAIQYADYAAYFHSADLAEHMRFFKEMLRCDFGPIGLPEKRCMGAGRGASRSYQIDPPTFAIGKKYAHDHKLTETMVFLGAFGILLAKYTGRTDILTSIILAGRGHKEIEDVVGMFANTLPIMLPVRGYTAEYIEGVRKLVLDLFDHQGVPFLSIAEAVGMDDKNVIDTSFIYQADGVKTLSLGTVKLIPEWIDTHTSKFGLSFELIPDGEGCAVHIGYDCSKYEDDLIDRLFAGYLRVIGQLDKEQIADISVLSADEYRKVVYDHNKTEVPFARDKCVHELFAQQAAASPDKIILVFRGKGFTYRQLDEMSDSLAHHLRARGIGPGTIVPIISRRSWHVIVAMLGVLKAGGAYMPVDPTYPKERIGYMLEAARCRLALTYGYPGQLAIERVRLEDFDFHEDSTPVENRNGPEDLCYIIFTSGSTGRPKGVSICHRNVTNYTADNGDNVCHRIIRANEQHIVSVTNIIFDIFVTESLLPLLNGVCIYLADDAQVASQKELAALIASAPIDVIQTTPTKMRCYIMDRQNVAYLRRLKTIVLGGEALPEDLYLELQGYTDARIFNVYGPAETTVWSTAACVEDTPITVGRPIANTQVYILDGDRKPLPVGVAGELYISGEGVGKGYLDNPGSTAERFVPNPFIPGTIMYRTGDLARRRADGEIEYLGRIDTQVKIHGQRIELGEIESVMSGFYGIDLAAVADKCDETGRQYLAGYYTTKTKIDEKELRRYLSAKLPRYMVPNYLVRLDEMPMTASGKMDRKRLPLPERDPAEREYAAPETEQESALCSILEDLLRSRRIGVTDDFFELGGDSLKAIGYVAKAHSSGISFALQDVFDYPTVRQLCDHLMGKPRMKVRYLEEDFARYQPLLSKNNIDENYIPMQRSLGDVFLTGATGFLGIHILDQLMREETGRIYCLVRGGGERLAEALRYYFDDLYTDEIGKRIIVVEGDITRADLADTWPEDIQTVIHAAATVKHYGSYAYFYEINVRGTQNVIGYARRIKARSIHISTLSVSGNSFVDVFDVRGADEPADFAESSLYIGQTLDNVYIRSKFEAERVVLDAVLDGLDGVIMRVGNLTNRVSDYKFQPNYRSNAFLMRVKAGLALGYLPEYLLPLYMEFSPVDQTAEGIIKIAQYADGQTVFHLNNDRVLYFDRMIQIMEQLGVKIEIVDGETFARILLQLSQEEDKRYIYEAFQNDMDGSGRLVYDSAIHIQNDFTSWFMKKIGYGWAKIDVDYIKGYVEYFRRLGYFKV